MSETIDLNLLRSFVAVAEAGGFTRAAERLQVPRATVSRRVAQLERNLGVRLFQRTTRSVSLSTAGAALHERVAPSLAALTEAFEGLPEVDDRPAGRLRITAPNDLSTALLPPIVSRFVAEFPAVSVELSVTNSLVDLVAGGFDCALRISTRRLTDSSLVAKRIGELPVHLFASKDYLAERAEPRRVTDLAKHACVVVTLQQPLRLENESKRTTVELRGRIETDDMLFAHQAVRQGLGVGALPAFLAAPDVATGRLRRVLPRWRARSGQLWMLWPGGRYVPQKTRRFCDTLEASLGATP